MLVGTCPYYLYVKGNVLFCEGATLKYPDKKSKENYFQQFCCNDDCGYHKCTMNVILSDYYERLYNGEKIERFPEKKTVMKGKKGRRPKIEGGS